jgi:FlaA1/EpsC-like NDP-sugar epimerase
VSSDDSASRRARDGWRAKLNLVRGQTPVSQAIVDALAWTVSIVIATLIRFDFHVTRVDIVGVAAMIPLAIEAQLVGGYITGLYRGRWRYGSFDEAAALARAASLTTGILFLISLGLDRHPVPLSSVLGAGFGALVLMAAARYVWRLRREQRLRPTGLGGESTRLLVFGAGEGGVQVVTAMQRDPNSPYIPVGIIDDDPAKRNLRILGVQVVGTRRRLIAEARRLHVDALLVAIPSAPAPLLREVSALADEAGLPVKVLPAVRDLFGGQIGVEDIRDIDTRDLLGRRQVQTDLDAVAGYLTGKRVLVTGAGGSIGSELCRQIVRFEPAELVMLDHYESGLHSVQLSIEGRALLDSDNLVLASIRDAEALREIFEARRPEVVFHAAALKHLPLLERHPTEAVLTNVVGTMNVLNAAQAAGVERLVNLSTDKAADPISVLGYSKRISERLTASTAQSTGRPYLSVRFGNVLLSSGSVLSTFQAQLASGAPLTVTHPEVSRYFMTVEEAVELVIQAGAIGRSGEVLVLDMGEPVRIADVAHRLAERQLDDDGDKREIVYTGLRPGEKLHEVLLGEGETDQRPVHPLISHVPVPPLAPEAIRGLDALDDNDDVVRGLRALCRATAIHRG